MTKHQLISTVREQISAGSTAEALQSLVTYLESDKKYRRLAKIARLTQAQFHETQQELRKGVISNAESDLVFNRVRHTMFDLLDDVENDNLRPDRYEMEKDNTSKRQLTVLVSILGVLLLGVASTLYFFVFKPDDGGSIGEEIIESCPTFETSSAFDVLLLPFYNFKEEPLNTAKAIQLRLRKLADNYQLKVSPVVFDDVVKARNVEFPIQSEVVAEQIGKECNCQLVIWGLEEESADGDILIHADYSYTGSTDNFKFTKIDLEGEEVTDTVRTISSIALHGSLVTLRIEQIVLTFFGIIAYEQGNYQAVITELEAGKDTTFIGNMILADSYLATNQEQKAIEKYDTVLARHPEYPLARNNRGLLLYKQERYVEAIEDFNVKLVLTPEDTTLLVARANAFIRTDQLDKAEEDLNAAQKLAPENPVIRRNLKSVHIEQRQRQAEIRRAETNLQANTNVVTSLTQRSDAFRSLGNTASAIQDARNAIRLDPGNPKPYAILVETYYQEKQEDELKKVIELARRNGVTKEAIANVNSTVKEILTAPRILTTPQMRAIKIN